MKPKPLIESRLFYNDVECHAWRRATRAVKRSSERQNIALGFRPVTLSGFLFWLRYWSPPALWLLKKRRSER